MIDAVVLAAGLSTRMGEPKPLTPIDGLPALGHVLKSLQRAGFESPIVVLGEEAERIRAAIDLTSCELRINPSPEVGLSLSLRLGLEAVNKEAVGALIALCDMPALRPATIRAVAERADMGAQVAAPTYRGRRGFPVFIAREYFPALRSVLAGDAGARDFIQRHPHLLETVDVDDPGCVLDFDRAEDLSRFGGSTPCTTFA